MSEFDSPEKNIDSKKEQHETEIENKQAETIEESSQLSHSDDNSKTEENKVADSDWYTYKEDDEQNIKENETVCSEEETDLYEEKVFSDDEELQPDVDKVKKDHFKRLKRYLASKIYDFSVLTKKQKTIRVTVFSVVLIFVILVMTDIIPILPNSYNRSYVGNNYVLGETIGSDVKKIGDGVIYASDGTVYCFGPDMKIESKISTFSGVPQIYSNGESAIVYSKNENKFLVMESMNNYSIKNIGENIYSAKVNSDGDYILLTSEAGYKSCLSAYSSSHKPIYEWHTNLNILDMAFSDDEKFIAVSVVDFDGASVSTRLSFIETSSSIPIHECEIVNQVVSEVFFTDDNTVVAVGDMSTSCYTANGHKKWEISYADKNLKSYDYSPDGTIVFLFNKYNSELSESTVEIYNTSGKFKGKYESKENVRSVSYNNGYCLLLLDKGTVLLDDDADLEKTKVLKDDFQKVVLYENYNFAFGIRDDTAEILSVKH